jgi:predicted RNA-binding protein with TRAM domain
VRVLNINELSHAMRPVALPGEDFELTIVQAGSNRDQGVGYLEDGTMVVVDNARRDIGSKITVKVTKTHQTVAGKMLFGAKVGGREQAPPKKTSNNQPVAKAPNSTVRATSAPKPSTHQQQASNNQPRPVITRAKQPRRRNPEASLLSAIEEQD